MHELAIAEAICDVASRHAAGRSVIAVEVRVGHLRQVVPDSLRFSWGLVTSGTALDGARLELETVATRVCCRTCGADSEPDGFPLVCARCGGFELDVVSGEELQVSALEIDERMAMIGDER